jgi:hypothetical protein
MTERPRIRNRRRRSDFIRRIKASWQKAVESIIETGQALLEAKDELEHGEFGDMIAQNLPFGQRTAESLMAIAEHPVLANPQFISHLPPSWGTLADLAGLPDYQLREWLASGAINPNLTRVAAAALIKAYRSAGDELRSLAGQLKVLIAIMEKHPDATPLIHYLNDCRDEDIISVSNLDKLNRWLSVLHTSWEHDEQERRHAN